MIRRRNDHDLELERVLEQGIGTWCWNGIWGRMIIDGSYCFSMTYSLPLPVLHQIRMSVSLFYGFFRRVSLFHDCVVEVEFSVFPWQGIDTLNISDLLPIPLPGKKTAAAASE
jgi:hypothetical protein